MNDNLFKYWLERYADVFPEEIGQIKERLGELPNAQAVLEKAIREKMNWQTVNGLLTTDYQKVDKLDNPPRVEQIKPRTDFTRKVKEVMGKIGSLFSNKRMLIGSGIGLGIIAVMVIAAIIYFGERPRNETTTFSVPEDPAATVMPAFSMEGSNEPEILTEGNTVEDVVQAEQTLMESEGPRTGFQMRAPDSIPGLFTEPDWNFLIFVATLALMIILTKQERFAEQQQNDWRIIRIGFILVAAGLFLNEILAAVLTQSVAFLFGAQFVLDPLWVEITFVFAAIVAFLTASITGKVDWTPLSVGLFSTGGLLVAFNPEGPGRLIGYGLIIGGLIAHVIELSSEQGTTGALGLVLVGLILFVGFRYGFEALLGLIGGASLPAGGDPGSDFVRWIAIFAYNSKVILATVLSLVVSFALASSVAALIFPPIARMLPQSGQLVGNLVPTEDTPRTDAVITFLMGVVCFWLVSGHF